MKATEKMIDVMKAYSEGKKIEWYDDELDEWKEIGHPSWDWARFDYRVQPKKQYRPYIDTEEMLDDFCERFNVTQTDYGEPFIWVKRRDECNGEIIKRLVTDIEKDAIWLCGAKFSMYDLFEECTYKNDSPCGKEIKE